MKATGTGSSINQPFRISVFYFAPPGEVRFEYTPMDIGDLVHTNRIEGQTVTVRLLFDGYDQGPGIPPITGLPVSGLAGGNRRFYNVYNEGNQATRGPYWCYLALLYMQPNGVPYDPTVRDLIIADHFTTKLIDWFWGAQINATEYDDSVVLELGQPEDERSRRLPWRTYDPSLIGNPAVF